MKFKTFAIRVLTPVSLPTVVGEKEKTNDTVNVRTRDNKVHGERSVDDVIAKFKELASKRILNSEEEWSSE